MKALSEDNLKAYGGKLYAYAQSEDAGDGGDAYYIKKTCSDVCKRYINWTTNKAKNCSCQTYDKTYYKYTYSYTASDDYCSGGYKDEEEDCTYSPNWWSDCNTCKTALNSDGSCPNNAGTKTVSRCQEWGTTNHQSGTCQIYTIPKNEFKQVKTLESVDATAKDTYDYNSANKTYLDKVIDGVAETVYNYRDSVSTDINVDFEVCNYGNTSIYSNGDGIFGSFLIGVDTVTSCDTTSLMDAFGDYIYKLPSGSATLSKITTKTSAEIYGAPGLPYDSAEDDFEAAFGSSCINTSAPDVANSCQNNTSTHSVTWSEEIPTSYEVKDTSESVNTCYSISQSFDNFNRSASYISAPEGTSNGYFDENRCICPQYAAGINGITKGASCAESENICAFVPDIVKGKPGGSGISCVTPTINAGLGLQYSGTSTILGGTRGSDKNCTGYGYKPIYTEEEYNNQPGQCYAENGIDTTGFARVEIGSYSCSVNTDGRQPEQDEGFAHGGKGARRILQGNSAPVVPSADAKSAVAIGDTNGTNSPGKNHIGYMLLHHYSDTPDEGGKYTYQYSWSENYLQYGEGGQAGEYKAIIIRSFGKDPIDITLGQGGAAGANGSGNSGQNGTATIVGNILTANGGTGGQGGLHTPTERLQAWYAGWDRTRGKDGTLGQTAQVTNFKSNILNLVLPIDNTVLGRWLAASGRGGDGGGSENSCWAGVYGRWFEGTSVTSPEYPYVSYPDQIECRNGVYWANKPAATAGEPGAVLIKW